MLENSPCARPDSAATPKGLIDTDFRVKQDMQVRIGPLRCCCDATATDAAPAAPTADAAAAATGRRLKSARAGQGKAKNMMEAYAGLLSNSNTIPARVRVDSKGASKGTAAARLQR